ncbi:hypothetical protein DPMN_153588 [Dreissena polymorpha]|uniref:Uncharacterized protein n=1 Tax=Dreissena polymorpha TaxID=45954 RepID=A0A9D4FLU4_DREPO|nr:hypothetical protein DPMN_153588 [Dreissena polymorpha]
MFDPGGAPGLEMGPCIVETDRIVIREVQYQLEVNWCRNEEIIVKGNLRWAWPMWAGCARRGSYQFEVNRCINEEIIVKGNFGWVWPMPCIVEINLNRCRNEEIIVGRPRTNRIVIREVQYQFEVKQCRNEEIIVKGNFGWASSAISAIHLTPTVDNFS